MGDEVFKRDVGIQAIVSIVKGKHDDADDSDDVHVMKRKTDAKESSDMEKLDKFKKVKR